MPIMPSKVCAVFVTRLGYCFLSPMTSSKSFAPTCRLPQIRCHKKPRSNPKKNTKTTQWGDAGPLLSRTRGRAMPRNAASKVAWAGRATVFSPGQGVLLAPAFGVATNHRIRLFRPYRQRAGLGPWLSPGGVRVHRMLRSPRGSAVPRGHELLIGWRPIRGGCDAAGASPRPRYRPGSPARAMRRGPGSCPVPSSSAPRSPPPRGA